MANKYQTLAVFFRGKGEASALGDNHCRNLRFKTRNYTKEGSTDLFKGGVWHDHKGNFDYAHVTWRMGELRDDVYANKLSPLTNEPYPEALKASMPKKLDSWAADRDALEPWFKANVEMFGWVSEQALDCDPDAYDITIPMKDAKTFKNLDELKTLIGWTAGRSRTSKYSSKVKIVDGKDAGLEFLKMLMKKDSE